MDFLFESFQKTRLSPEGITLARPYPEKEIEAEAEHNTGACNSMLVLVAYGASRGQRTGVKGCSIRHGLNIV
jgi:hypothetical protein